jgi:hypothetical protein
VAVPANTAPGAPAPVAPAAPVYTVSPEFLQSTVKTISAGIDAKRVRSVYVKVLNISQKQDLAKEFAQEAAAPPGCIDSLAGSAGELAKKYPQLAQYSPEAVFITALLTWAGTSLSLSAKLDKLERQIVEARKAKESAGAAPKLAGQP